KAVKPMEARRRRESAKSSAATVLPSTQDEAFNLRLIELYGKQECLWNTSLPDFENKELKDLAWQNIVKQLGSHLTTVFLRSRIRNLRHGLNVYKLHEIEYKMCPNNDKLPEKPYYSDQFAFLEKLEQPQIISPEAKEAKDAKEIDPLSNLKEDIKKRFSRLETQNIQTNTGSIADMVKQRLAEHAKLPMHAVRRRLKVSISSSSDADVDNSSTSSSHVTGLPGRMPRSILKARPGESISQTKLMNPSKAVALPQDGEIESEDEELYHLHWNIRKNMSLQRRRTSTLRNNQELRNSKTPEMPLTLRSKVSTEDLDDII
ncbi:uncharacterized protein LOC6648614, partial [Drosophila willistoni]|uniref:uncharacterized protein LOC6648614 n=1 Tax=Drosophila willistoni TaxID=7260 RepID=UPI000C26CC8F